MRHALRYLPAFLALMIPLVALAYLGSQELSRLQARAESSMRAHALDFLSVAVGRFDSALERECVGLLDGSFDRDAEDLVAAARACQANHSEVLELVVLDDEVQVVHPRPAGTPFGGPWQSSMSGSAGRRRGSSARPEEPSPLQRARVLSARGDIAEAIEVLEQQIARGWDGDDLLEARTRLQLVANLRAANEPARALELVTALRKDLSERPDDPSRGARRFRRGARRAERAEVSLQTEVVHAELTQQVKGQSDGLIDLLRDLGAGRWGDTSDEFLDAIFTYVARSLTEEHTETTERAQLGLAHYVAGRRLVRDLQLGRSRGLSARLRTAPAGDLVYDVRDTPWGTCLLVFDQLGEDEAARFGGRWVGFVLDLGSFVNRQLADHLSQADTEFFLDVLDPSGGRVLRDRLPDSDTDPRTDVVSLAAAAGLRFHAIPANAETLLQGRRATARNSALLVLALCLVAGGGAFFLVRSVGREAQLAQLKVDLVSRVSHELKTPLAMIKMYGETLALGRTKDGEQSARFAGIITRESDRLTVMIDRILDFSKQQAGKITYNAQEVDLTDLIRSVTDEYRPHVAAAGLSLQVALGGPLQVEVDREAMESALINLLENAVKYTPAASPAREIAVAVRPDGEHAVVEVADRGVGIPAPERKQIFTSFYRARTAGEVRGAGIGLSLVHHFVTAHGGQIEAIPRDGGGTVFRLSLPRPSNQREHDDHGT